MKTDQSRPEIKVVFWGILSIVAVFLVIPMVFLFWQSLMSPGGTGFQNYVETALNPKFREAFGNSFLISSAAGIISTCLAFLLAYTVNNTALPGKLRSLISCMAVFPMLLPTITYGFVIIYSFGREGLITKLLGFQPFSIYGCNGMLLGYVIYTLPIAFLLINNTFKYVDRNFSTVSRIMGDSPMKTFLATSVRPLVGTLGAAFIQSFTLSFTDFGIPSSIGGTFDVVALHLYNVMLGSVPDFAGGSTVAMMMLLPSLISILVIGYLERFNFRYNKISQQEPGKGRVRDVLCGGFSMIILTVVVLVFAVMFVVPFVKGWPYDPTFTLKHVLHLISSPNLLSIYGNSLFVAVCTAAAGTAVSFGAALVAARAENGTMMKSVVNGIAIVANTIPGMVLGIAFLFAFSGTSLQNSFAILIACNVIHFFTTPYLMGKNSLEKLNKGWEATAALMGDKWLKTLCRVIIPNTRGTIMEMFGYYFINSMITVSALIFLVGARTSVITTKIKELQHFAKFDEIFVMSILILLTNVAVRLVLSRFSRKRHAQ